MKQLWSPWRMEYIRREKPDGCVFCALPQEDNDPKSLILLRGTHCYVMLNRYPYNNGHLMIVPYEHVDSPAKLAPDVLQDMMWQVNISLTVLKKAMNPDGFNIGMNLGASAGAGIRDHIHMHVVPRWTGDTNFMSVLADTHVIVEGLAECYSQLKPLFECECDPARQSAPEE
jgi:ATP adenylyltransferase